MDVHYSSKDSSSVMAMIYESARSTSSADSSEIVWKEGAPSSSDAARPILLAVGKEDKYLLNKLIPPVDAEVSCLQFRVVVFDQEYCSGVEFYRSTNDGKMQLLLGRSCAFCVLRSYSEDDAILTEQIVEGFEIGEVDIDSLKSLYDNFKVDIVQSCPRGLHLQAWSNDESHYILQCQNLSDSACPITWYTLLLTR